MQKHRLISIWFLLLFIVPCSAFAQQEGRQPASAEQFAPGVLPRNRLPKTRALDYEFDEVRIATILGWLQRVSVEPPVKLGGIVSGWLWAQAPASGWWRLGDYRVEGELTSPLLSIDRFAIQSARVRFGYRQSQWTVGSASGQIESVAADNARLVLGQIQTSAGLPMSAEGNAHVEGELQAVELSNLLATFGVTENAPRGQARGTFRIDTKLANLSNPVSWDASGQITAAPIEFGTVKELHLSSGWSLTRGLLALPNAQVGLGDLSVAAAAQLQLTQNFAWQLQLPKQLIELNQQFYAPLLTALSLKASIAQLPQGTLQLASLNTGTLSPWHASYAVDVSDGQLAILGNRWTATSARVALNAQGLTLESLAGQVAGGRLRGSAGFTTDAAQPLTVDLTYEGLDLAQLRAPIELPGMIGRVTGSAKLSVDKQQIANVTAWNLDLQGAGTSVRISDWGLGNIQYTLKKTSGLDAIELSIQDASLTRRWLATGDLVNDADGNWQYDIDARGNQLDLSIAQLLALMGTQPELPVPLEVLLVTGGVTLHGNTQAGLQSTDFNFSDITTLERDRRVWSQGSMIGRTTDQFIEIAQSQWTVAGSEVDLALVWHYDSARNEPLAVEQVPNAADGKPSPALDRIALKLDDLKLDTLRAWRIIPLPANIAEQAGLQGKLSSQIDVTRPKHFQSWLAGWEGKLNLQLDEFSIGSLTPTSLTKPLVESPNISLSNLTLAGELTSAQWQGNLQGTLLTAPVAGDLTLSISQERAWNVRAAKGQVTWLGAELGQLMSLWQVRANAAQWRGDTNLRLQFDWQQGSDPTGVAEFDVPQLAFKNRSIIRDLRASAKLAENRLQLVRFDGSLGGGRVDVSGGLNLTTRMPEGLTVQLQRIALEEVVQLVDPDLTKEVTGRADVRGRINFERGLDMHGDVRVHDANWSGLPISNMHTGFELTSSADWSLTRLRAANIRGLLFDGRFDGDLQARFGTRTSLTLRARVGRGEVEQLSKWTGTSSVVGKGHFDADLAVTSPNFKTLSDLQGNLDVRFEDTNARTLPVADQLARFVPLFGLPSTEFERGRLQATLSRGDLRMRSLALWGKQLSVLGSGNMGLVSSRLDMQLVIRTGGGLSQQVAANYLTQLAAASVPPVEIVLQVNRLVANRAIFLRVGGTTAQPIIQPQAGRIIEQALLRSLLEQAVVIAP